MFDVNVCKKLPGDNCNIGFIIKIITNLAFDAWKTT